MIVKRLVKPLQYMSPRPCSRRCVTRTRMRSAQVSSSRAGIRNQDQVSIISLLVAVSSDSLGLSEVGPMTQWPSQVNLTVVYAGSGSTYVYGYCDATYREGWGRDETVNFVRNSEFCHLRDFEVVLNAFQPLPSPCQETVHQVAPLGCALSQRIAWSGCLFPETSFPNSGRVKMC